MAGAHFQELLMSALPRMRVQALALTRNRSRADDLVQDAVCSALKASDTFTIGTNFNAWMHRIVRNRFISDLRKFRSDVNIDLTPAELSSTAEIQSNAVLLKELGMAVDRLSNDQREALILVVVHGLSYEELAEQSGCAVGTAKSRVFRARRNLERWLVGTTEPRGDDEDREVPLARLDRSRTTAPKPFEAPIQMASHRSLAVAESKQPITISMNNRLTS